MIAEKDPFSRVQVQGSWGRKHTAIGTCRRNCREGQSLEILVFSVKYLVPRMAKGSREYARTVLLELIRSLALVQDHACVQLLLQPGKVAHERRTVPNVRLPKAYAIIGLLSRRTATRRL